jgi:rod shape-determining protein MreD
MNTPLLSIILLGFYLKDYKRLIILAFTLGLVNDFYQANPIGISSLIFLSLIFLLYLYRKKFFLNHILFQLAFIFLSNFLYLLIFKKAIIWQNILLWMGASLIIIVIINKIKGGSKQIIVE